MESLLGALHTEKLIQYVKTNENFDKNFQTSSKFKRNGKQGIVGVLKLQEDDSCVYKISKYMNYLVDHEYLVMKSLNDLKNYCPHFCKVYGKVQKQVDPSYKRIDNPFEINSKHPVTQDVLLMEYIPKKKLYNLFKSRVSDDIIYSQIKQVLMAISIAQQKKEFVHYDLHSQNIIVKDCDKDDVFLYVLDEHNQFCIPTYGHYPVIIDFGYSYTGDMKGGPCFPTTAHTDVGFMSCLFDARADPKLFLVTISDELEQKRPSKNSRILRNIIKNIFKPLEIDWESGWDNVDQLSAADCVSQAIESDNVNSKLFEKYNHFCVDILHSLITLPLKPKSHKNLHKAYKTMIKEFCKIEKEIGSSFYNLYLFKVIVDCIRKIRKKYENKETQKEALKEFKTVLFEKTREVANFCNPKKIHYEKLFVSILVFASNMEGILYQIISARMVEKNEEYDQMQLKTIEQIFGVIEVNIPDNYVFNENTKIHVFDCVNEKYEKITLLTEKYNEYLTNIHPMLRGSALYDIYTGKDIQILQLGEEGEEESDGENDEESGEENDEESGEENNEESGEENNEESGEENNEESGDEDNMSLSDISDIK
jgi:hypothetical protein